MKPLVIIPFHDPTWEKNCLDNLARQETKTDYLFIPGYNHHALAVNAGVSYAKEYDYSHVICFDSDDYYGPQYVSKQLKALESFDYTGKQSIYTKFVSEKGLYSFDRIGRPFLFATIACAVDKFLPVKPVFQNCDDWTNRMTEAGYSSSDTGLTDYCYFRHGNNAHWNSPDILVKKGWGKIKYYKKLCFKDCSNLHDNFVIKEEPTNEEIYKFMETI